MQKLSPQSSPKEDKEVTPTSYTSGNDSFSKNQYAFTDLGSAFLKRQHEMKVDLLDDSKSLRARVLDQRVFDSLYLKDQINGNQFNASEKLLSLAHKSGIFPSNSVWKSFETGAACGGKQCIFLRNNFIGLKSLILLGATKHLNKKGGKKISRIVWDVIVEDQTPEESQMDSLRFGLDLLYGYWFPVFTKRSNSSSINRSN